MDTQSAAHRYAETLRRAWPAGDVDAFLALFARDAEFQPPFGAPEAARDHMRRALSHGDAPAEVWVGEAVVSGDTAVLEWWGVLTSEGSSTTFAATAWVRFNRDGMVIHERDYWNSTSGCLEPRPGWG